jgi:predicted RND superfamily exporter protein
VLSPDAAAAVIRNRKAVLALAVALAIVSALGVLRLRVDFSSEAFYGNDDPRRAALERMRDHFGPDDDRLVAIAELDATTDGAIPALADLAALTDAARGHPRVTEVRSLTTELRSRGLAGDRVPPAVLDAIRASPAVPLLVSEAFDYAAIVIRIDRSTDDLLAAVPVVESVQAALDAAAAARGIRVDFAGLPAIRAAFFASVVHDQLRFGPATFVLIALGLAIAFRRVHAVLIGLTIAGLPTLFLAGAFGWLGVPVGLLNQVDFTLIPVLAVAGFVHLLVHVHADLATPSTDARGPRRANVLAESVSRISRPIALASVTTAAGFASLGVSAMPALRDFGVEAGLAMLVVGVVVVVVGTAALACSGLPPIHRATTNEVSSPLARVSRASAERYRLVLGAAVIVTVGAGLGAARVQVDNRLGSLLNTEHPVRVASDTLDDRLGGTLGLSVLAREEPQTEADMQELLRWAAREPRIRASTGIERSQGAVRVVLWTADDGGIAFSGLERDVSRWIVRRGRDWEVTGTASVAYAGVNRIAGSLRTSLAVAVALVTGLMIVLLRRGIGAGRVLWVATLPNALPLLLGVAALGWLDRTLDPVPGAVLVLALGIAVDDTVHLLARAARLESEGRSPTDAIVGSVTTAGRAVTITTLVVGLGFAVNLAASFPALVMLGTLGTFVLFCAWIADIVLLPALYVAGRGSP